jgi:hypothetical protein
MAWEVKEGVDLRNLHISMRKALITCEKAYAKIGVTMRITSTGEGKHSIGSLHYYGYAFDLRTSNVPESRLNELHDLIRKGFEHTRYQIIKEKTHFHVENQEAVKL